MCKLSPPGVGRHQNTSDPPGQKSDGQVNNRIFRSRCASLRSYTAWIRDHFLEQSKGSVLRRRSNAFTDHCTRFRFHALRSAQTITTKGFSFFHSGPKIDSEMLLEANVKYGLHCMHHRRRNSTLLSTGN